MDDLNLCISCIGLDHFLDIYNPVYLGSSKYSISEVYCMM